MAAFDALQWAIAAIVIWVVWRALRGLFRTKAQVMVCATCGHHGAAAVKTRGSFAIEVVLWLMFIVPGLVYSLWRLSTRGTACASCGGTTLVAPDSPVGRKMLAAQGPSAGAGPTQ